LADTFASSFETWLSAGTGFKLHKFDLAPFSSSSPKHTDVGFFGSCLSKSIGLNVRNYNVKTKGTIKFTGVVCSVPFIICEEKKTSEKFGLARARVKISVELTVRSIQTHKICVVRDPINNCRVTLWSTDDMSLSQRS